MVRIGIRKYARLLLEAKIKAYEAINEGILNFTLEQVAQ